MQESRENARKDLFASDNKNGTSHYVLAVHEIQKGPDPDIGQMAHI